MTKEVCKLEKDLCRCCHSEGAFKSLYASYLFLDVDEVVYYNMLRDCFDIELAQVTTPASGMLCAICDTCILRLHDAMEFKHQVQKCERRFRNIYMKNFSDDFKVDVKQELPDFEDDGTANTTTSTHNGAIKDNPNGIKLGDDGRISDDGGISDRDDFDCKLEDKEEVPIQTIKNAKQKKTKAGSSKVKQKKSVGRPKKKLASTKAEEVVDTIQGVIKVVKRPGFRLQEGIDYKQVADEFQCCRCEKIFKSPYLLKHHVKTVHLRIPKYTCAICSQTFHTLAPFVKHKLEEHNIDERHKCNACDTIFNTRIQLKRHINSFHMLGEKSKCDQCDYETFSVEALYKHKFKHKTVKDYHCVYCRKSFVRKTTLQLHERIHTGDRRKVCKVCGQAFVQKASLNYHMTKYHPGVNF